MDKFHSVRALDFERAIRKMLIWSNGFRDAEMRTSALKYGMGVVVGYMEWCERVNRETSCEVESFRIRLQDGERGKQRRGKCLCICNNCDAIVNKH